MKAPAVLCLLFAFLPALRAQAGAGLLRGVVADGFDRPVAAAAITVRGAMEAFLAHASSRATGEFEIALPYGEYRVEAGGSEVAVTVSPLRPVCVKIAPQGGGAIPCPGNAPPWNARPDGHVQSLADEPTTVTEPLDFSGPVSTPFPLVSQRAISWTGVRYTVQ